jgi:hypothetical protein
MTRRYRPVTRIGEEIVIDANRTQHPVLARSVRHAS